MCSSSSAGVVSDYPLSSLYHNLQTLHLQQNQMISGFSGVGIMQPNSRMYGQGGSSGYVDESLEAYGCTEPVSMQYCSSDTTSPDPGVVPFSMDGMMLRSGLAYAGGVESLDGVQSVVCMDSVVQNSPPLAGHQNLLPISEDTYFHGVSTAATISVSDNAAVMQDMQQRLLLRPNISPPNPVINVTDALGRVMPVLVITGGDGTTMSADDDATVRVQVSPSTSSAAAGFGVGYFSAYGSTTGCN